MKHSSPRIRFAYGDVTKAAKQLRVSRITLWRAITGRFENPGLVTRFNILVRKWNDDEAAVFAPPRSGLYSHPMDCQIDAARRAVPLIAAALAKFEASNEKAEREALAGESLLPLVTDLHGDFKEIARVELEAVSAAGDAALRPFIEGGFRRAIFVGKLDMPLSLRLGLDMPVSAENAEHILRAMRTLFADVLASSPEPES